MEPPQELSNLLTGPMPHLYYGYAQDPSVLATINDTADSFDDAEPLNGYMAEAPPHHGAYFAAYPQQPYFPTPVEELTSHNGLYSQESTPYQSSYFDFLPPAPVPQTSPLEEYRPQPDHDMAHAYSVESPLMATPSSGSAASSFAGYPSHSSQFASRTSSASSLSPMPAAHRSKPQGLGLAVPRGAAKEFKIVRGISGGGSVTRPPSTSEHSPVKYVPIRLKLHDASVAHLHRVPWDRAEADDGRRIIRVERVQHTNVLDAYFSVVGSATHHPAPAPSAPGVDAIEVSCLRYDPADDEDDETSYYITSVEVVNLIETLIGVRSMDPALRRREKGRIRSNLMPFWSKKPVPSQRTANNHNLSQSRSEFARRIMGYKIRKPRGFDKDVRILSWRKLIPALHRALSCYYAEVPAFMHVDEDLD